MKPSLAEVQALFMAGILQDAGSILPLVRTPPNDTRDVMFGVYRNAYILRLTEFLSNDHPRLKIYLGDDAFFDMSRAYAKAHPSDTPNARWYSRHLPEFLAQHQPWAAHRDVFELAMVERALTDSFDSPDGPVFTLEELMQLDPEEFENARLSLHPSLRCLRLTTNATELWSGLKDDNLPSPPPAVLAEPMTAISWREGGGARLRLLNSEEAMTLASAIDGVPFGVLCEMIAVMGQGDTAAIRAATYLRQWISNEIVSAISTG